MQAAARIRGQQISGRIELPEHDTPLCSLTILGDIGETATNGAGHQMTRQSEWAHQSLCLASSCAGTSSGAAAASLSSKRQPVVPNHSRTPGKLGEVSCMVLCWLSIAPRQLCNYSHTARRDAAAAELVKPPSRRVKARSNPLLALRLTCFCIIFPDLTSGIQLLVLFNLLISIDPLCSQPASDLTYWPG